MTPNPSQGADRDAPDPVHPQPCRAALALVAAALALATLFMLLGPPRGERRAAGATLKVSTAQNATLGKRILVTTGGRTLYSLSAETRGRFICTDAAARHVAAADAQGRRAADRRQRASARSSAPTAAAR